MEAKISGGSGGNCRGLGEYLEKERKGQWFSQAREQLGVGEVVASIDANKKNLGLQDEKYYQVILSPSQQELDHIGNDKAQLAAYTRAAMEVYAANFGFGKGIASRDLVWPRSSKAAATPIRIGWYRPAIWHGVRRKRGPRRTFTSS